MNHDLINQFRALTDKDQSLSAQISELDMELPTLRPSLMRPDRGTDEDKARSAMLKKGEAQYAELKSKREEIRRALANLQNGSDTRMKLAQSLYQEAVKQLEQVDQDLASFQRSITEITTAVGHAEKRLADASIQLENALSADAMTVASATLADATREIEHARLLQRNTERRVAELTTQRKLAIQELEHARCGVWEAKTADLVDELRATAMNAALAAFAAAGAARKGAVGFSEFLVAALNPDGTCPPGLEAHQARMSKQLGIPA